MRRLALFAVLLVVPAGNAAIRPANGCPAPCSGQISSPASDRLLFVQPAGVPGPVAAYDTSTGSLRFLLPAGLTSADGRLHFAAHAGRTGTVVSRHAVGTGALEDSFLLDGRWRIAGVSPTGRYVALSRRSVDRSRTWVEIRSASGARAHSLELHGDFEVETVSRDGARLFLIEHLRGSGSPRYLVRLFDLARDRLASAPLRGRGEPSVMAGLAWSGIGSPDGRWLLTLYLNSPSLKTGRSVAFVHALDLVRSSPLCIFLPTGDSFEELKSYGLTLSPDGKKLYAANAELGAVAEIDLATRKVVRTVRFAGRKAPSAAASLSGTISRNGRTLYFSGGRDLYAYDAAYGLVRGPYRTGGAIRGFGFGAGDRRVHALRADGRMLTFDAATGKAIR